MELRVRIKTLIDIFKVANDTIIGSTARQLFNLKWQEGLSERNQAHKILDELALTKQIIKGKGFYAVTGYQGQYQEHDRAITECISKLILLKHPISLYRETSLSGGIRPDITGMIGKNGKVLAFVLECCLSEADSYLEQKATFWRHHNPLQEVFGIPIPHFTLVVHGKTHPEMVDFKSFLEVLK